MSIFRTLIVVILLLAGPVGYSQKIVPGYIVTAGQDSLRGAIIVHDEAMQQTQVDFIMAQGNQRQRLDVRQLTAYGYTTQKDTVRYIAVSMNLGRTAKAEALFLRQLVAGPVELYRYCYSRDYYNQPARVATDVRPNTSRPSLVTWPVCGLAFPPLSVTSARGGTGVALLLRRHGQPDYAEATNWNFPADAAAYFADCPALASDLQARRYHARNLLQLVRRYNACQAAGH